MIPHVKDGIPDMEFEIWQDKVLFPYISNCSLHETSQTDTQTQKNLKKKNRSKKD